MKLSAATLFLLGAVMSAQPPRGPQPEFLRQGQQLVREGRFDDALEIYMKQLEATPDSLPAHNAAGVLLDLMGRTAEARKHFARAIEAAPVPQAKAQAQRAMAISYAFDGDCENTAKFEQMVFDYWVTVPDFYQQGEMADEAARVCIDAGELDAAYRWYKIGHDAGLKEPNIKPERADLWEFRWEHAQARIAARRGRKAEAEKHVAVAKAILDKNPEMAKGQAIFYPYLTGYVALHGGDLKTALAEFEKANQNDAFIQCLIAECYEKLGDKGKAMEYYRKASKATMHNPPGAYARRITRQKLGG